MQVTKTSIIKTTSPQKAILAAINEWFSDKAIASFTELLVVHGEVGTCIEIEDKESYVNTSTNYFIVTPLSAGLVRVEYCSSFSLVWK
jgi:hypothetical protein